MEMTDEVRKQLMEMAGIQVKLIEIVLLGLRVTNIAEDII
jgi:uncharacterized alkaline shock family protein YloU